MAVYIQMFGRWCTTHGLQFSKKDFLPYKTFPRQTANGEVHHEQEIELKWPLEGVLPQIKYKDRTEGTVNRGRQIACEQIMAQLAELVCDQLPLRANAPVMDLQSSKVHELFPGDSLPVWLEKEITRHLAFGLDLEWCPGSKTCHQSECSKQVTTIQFAFGGTIIVQHVENPRVLPPTAKAIFERVITTDGARIFGVDLRQDIRKIELFFTGVALQLLDEKIKDCVSSTNCDFFMYHPSIGTEKLVAIFLDKKVDKHMDVSTSYLCNLSAKSLNEAQLKYAALDALAALELGLAIEAKLQARQLDNEGPAAILSFSRRT